MLGINRIITMLQMHRRFAPKNQKIQKIGVKSLLLILLKNPLAKTLSYVDRRGATNVFHGGSAFQS